MSYTLLANNRELALNETELLGPFVGYIENEDQVIYGSYPKDTPVHIEYDASTGEYMVESSVHLQVTSDMTLTLRVKYQNITVSNNAVLTIDDGIICQATDTITVEEGSQIRVKPTAILVAGTNGIVTADVDGLYLESILDTNASVIFNGTTENNQPLATTEMAMHCINSGGNYMWQQFAFPMLFNEEAIITKNYVITYNYWDTTNGWTPPASAAAILSLRTPWELYNTTTNSTVPGLLFKFLGNLIGNSNHIFNFNRQNAWEVIGNCFTGTLHIKTLLTILSSSISNPEIQWYNPSNSTLIAYNLDNVDSMPIQDLYSMAGVFVHITTSPVAIAINYNDVILAYYKQKYNIK